MLLPKDYIRLKLTGDYATDVSDASGTLLFDVPNRRWSKAVLDKLGIPADWMPPAFEGPEITGTLSSEVAESVGLAMVAGYYCTFKDSIYSIYHCLCNCVPNMLDWGEMREIAALIAPRPLLVISGKQDAIFPIKATRRAYAELRDFQLYAEGVQDMTGWEFSETQGLYIKVE